MTPAVTVSIVTWNSARVLRACLNALAAQTFRDFAIIIVDNASADETRTLIKELAPHASLIPNQRNVGFGRAHNQAILLSSSQYVLCLNPDAVLEPSALQVLVRRLDADEEIAAVGPKLLRFESGPDELNTVKKTGIVDSAGIVETRWGGFVERGANQADTGQFGVSGDVFAVSGACSLFRRAALEEIRIRNEYFDEDYFLYKEDIDLCWRLRSRGWRIVYEPGAVVYHRRSVGPPELNFSPRHQHRQRRQRSQLIRTLSYRNHFLTVWKNQPLGTLLKRLPLTLGYELGKFVFLAGSEPRTLRGLGSALRHLPQTLSKRRLILRHRRANHHGTLDRHPQLSK